MVGEVGGLVDEAVAVAVDGLDDHFRGLFAHFLGDGLGTLDEELRGIGTVRHLRVTALDELREGADETFIFRRVEAGRRAAMAGRAGRIGLDEEGVAVAVCKHLLDGQEVATGLALGPQPLLGTREECDAPFLDGLVEGGAVHIAEHQDLERGGVLDDDGEQSVPGLAEVKIVESHDCQSFISERECRLRRAGA